MESFNNNKKVKDELLSSLKHHQELDAFIQGCWIDKSEGKIKGNGFRGCFYGCTMQTSDNPIGKFSKKYNIDLWYCYLTEKLFEDLPDGEYQKFPYNSIDIVPVGFDFNLIKSEWNQIILRDQLRFVHKGSNQEKVIQKCIDLFSVPFNKITYSAVDVVDLVDLVAYSADLVAYSAAHSAYLAAGSARSADSAYLAAGSAYSAAHSVGLAGLANSAGLAHSAAYSAAHSAHCKWMRDQMFGLIKKYS